jgi:hypothetical protein
MILDLERFLAELESGEAREATQAKLTDAEPVRPAGRHLGEADLAWWEPGGVCWHCGGHGQCRCITCDAGPGVEPLAGECVICHGSGRVPERVQ